MASSVLHVVGEVVGKPRPRFTSYGGRVRTFTPKKGETFESIVRVAYQAQGGTMHDGAVEVEIAYRRPMPKSRPKKVDREWDSFKPDIDNVAKAVLDALNGVAFADDKDVVSLKAVKLPRVRCPQEELYVRVSEVDDCTEYVMEETWLRFTNSTEL